tara:strand:- start:619 stop:783 length:165 start_codon:yes stop_codon:yes gene_type:complete
MKKNKEEVSKIKRSRWSWLLHSNVFLKIETKYKKELRKYPEPPQGLMFLQENKE